MPWTAEIVKNSIIEHRKINKKHVKFVRGAQNFRLNEWITTLVRLLIDWFRGRHEPQNYIGMGGVQVQTCCMHINHNNVTQRQAYKLRYN